MKPLSPLAKGKKKMFLELFLVAVLSPTVAVADPNIQLDMSVAKEIVIEENGQEVAQWVEAEDIEPGQKLRYTVRYINVGDEPATEVRIENPIPDLTVYVSDSASGEGSTIVFSADGGENYGAPEEVTYEVAVFGGGTDRRKANPERYTNIRWLIEEVPAGSAGEISFLVLVE
jgi:uncharacterized repeat protein (TIGR01451 family)